MPLERLVTDIPIRTVKLAETLIKETWNKLDAAAEKPKPSEFLGEKAIDAIQGS